MRMPVKGDVDQTVVESSMRPSSIFVFHGTWVPGGGPGFDNGGQFIVWVETSNEQRAEASGKESAHPCHLSDPTRLKDIVSADLSVGKALIETVQSAPARFHATLPSAAERPLPSIEMAQLSGKYLSDDFVWKTWEIHGIAIGRPLALLRELQFIAGFTRPGRHLGGDLVFWIRYAQQLRSVVRQHQFLPVMKCARPGRKGGGMRIHAGWSPESAIYERGLREFAACIPGICRNVSDRLPKKRRTARIDGLSGIDLLRHFSEQQVDRLVADTPVTKQLLKRLEGSWLINALGPGERDDLAGQAADGDLTTERWKQWRAWQGEILGRSNDSQDTRGDGFTLGLRLHQVDERRDNDWRISLFVASSEDLSLRIDLADWWALPDGKRARWLKHFGRQFERHLLVGMGHAARMCPLLWQGMESAQPTGVDIDLQAAYEFLKDDAPVLESAGFRILLPSWWTPQGRKRARIRINAVGKPRASGEAGSGSGHFDMPSLVRFRYELAIGGEPVSEQEWKDLVGAKSPLVRFRGEWMELDARQMDSMLELWRRQEREDGASTVGNLLKRFAEADEETTEFVLDQVLDDILGKLRRQRGFKPLDQPAGLRGRLRPYQMEGLSWLATQESLGLNPCLADDMGLGKTLQVIALLLHERGRIKGGNEPRPPPTLLIAPTSVLSNWRKEVEKFAPRLKSMIHHGSERLNEAAAFGKAIAAADIVITSFAIARRDGKLLRQAKWRRIVVDEAQNIKNPRSAQARAIRSLKAPSRIALTGTPIENRLMDLWSLFNFLNPGYLGTAAQFRRAYETPIQRGDDQSRARQLHRLVRPFLLRRLKTDPAIIDDLPEKLEQKVYCNLTREQASLYQAVVEDAQEQIEESEGIQRKGLMLSTLTKLKQICNHPAQFLQDESAFSEARSHKLTRLNEMIGEALDESDSLLVFTQFTEVGKRLEALARRKHGCPVHYLHGGTSRRRREQMIESYQDADAPPGIFILSLRAGGVGINLTRANHVFHFDRWWNPAVEDQATDRAYRIGQRKTVFAHKMVTVGTLEERIDRMIEEKKALAESIVGAGEGWLTEMDNAAFRELIRLNRAAIMES